MRAVPHGEVPFCILEWDAGRYLINTIDCFMECVEKNRRKYKIINYTCFKIPQNLVMVVILFALDDFGAWLTVWK